MQIGVPRERKDREFRVGVVPEGVRSLRTLGHQVLIEEGAGEGSGSGRAGSSGFSRSSGSSRSHS